MIKSYSEMTDKNKYVYIRSRSRKELKDATLLLICGFTWSYITIILLTLSKFKIVAFILISLIMLLSKNIYIIYFKYSKKYRLGNSYVKRKWKITGGLINIYCIFTTSNMYNINGEDMEVWLVLNVVFFGFILITHRWLVNKLWYEIDKTFYLEIDKKNPYQKKYLLEPKFYWSGINNNGDDEPQ